MGARVLALLLATGCGGVEQDRGAGEPAMDRRPIEQVLAEHTPRLMQIPGVEGVGQGLCDGAPCIRVYVRDSAAAARLPPRLDGYPVSPVVTGPFTPRTGD